VLYHVQLTARAEADLDEILQGIQAQASTVLASWHSRMMSQIQTLSRLPHRCSIASEASDVGCELRELLFGKRRGCYRILFTIGSDTVTVLHIRRAARGAVTADDLK
jgi:plasmid stabilization system protein ParE